MKSFINYYGGKSRLTDEIISIMPPHKTYIEAFCGASWLLFAKPESNIEVINDIDSEIINLYFVVKNQLFDFINLLNKIPISEKLFDIFRYQKGIPFVDLRKLLLNEKGIPKMATITYYNILNCFNSNISKNPTFCIDRNKQSNFVKFYKTDWELISERLKKVTILNRDYKEVIKLYDSKESLFYLDPPYTITNNIDKYYKHNFSIKDHKELLAILKCIEGKFILSYDNSDKIKDMYGDFNIIELKEYPKELIIINFDESEYNYFSCRKGIPLTARVSDNEKAKWKYPSCPYCESRNVKQVSKRVTIKGSKRNWMPCGYVCESCNELYRVT
jgi:DNA adenine methylase